MTRYAARSVFALLLVAPALLSAQAPDHARFTAVLRAHASERGVDYAGLQANRTDLDRYVAEIGAVASSEFDAWNRSQQLAYLINAYNAIVLQSVIDHYPIKRSLKPAALVRPANSVWQIAGFFSGRQHRVAGSSLTLDDIEHKLLRARLKEPRIHFALVCAARSCPPLRPGAYLADSIDSQLNDQAREFLNDPERNRFDRQRGVIHLSEIFKWFAEDFGDRDQAILDFVSAYVSDADTRVWLRAGNVRIRHFDYNWNLNDATAH